MKIIMYFSSGDKFIGDLLPPHVKIVKHKPS